MCCARKSWQKAIFGGKPVVFGISRDLKQIFTEPGLFS